MGINKLYLLGACVLLYLDDQNLDFRGRFFLLSPRGERFPWGWRCLLGVKTLCTPLQTSKELSVFTSMEVGINGLALHLRVKVPRGAKVHP
jgi:hypothetical protein